MFLMTNKINIEELSKPLNVAYVSERKQGGTTLSYVESWRVIEEANRIFGFTNWYRETIQNDVVCVSTREIGKSTGFDVTYRAKVRVTVFHEDRAIIREGTGCGNGISQNESMAHEKACKEAESDAMKRALMTFGYPFGLALYDKKKENVVDYEAIENEEKRLAEEYERLKKWVPKAIESLLKKETIDELNAWHEKNKETIVLLDNHKDLKVEFETPYAQHIDYIIDNIK